MLTLVRDTYRAADDAGELLDLSDVAGHPASSEDITGHLLDRVLPAAYTPQPGDPPPRYDLPAAERALRSIATRMNKAGTRDLQWWRVPAWTHAAPRVIVTWLGAALAAGITAEIAWGIVYQPVDGLAAGITAGITAGIVFGRGSKIPKRIAPVRWSQLFRPGPLVAGLLAGIVTVFEITRVYVVAGVVVGAAAGLVAWLGVGVVAGMSLPGTDSTSPLSPLSSRRSDQAFGLAAGIVTCLGVGLLTGTIEVFSLGGRGLTGRIVAGWLGITLGAGLLVGLVYPQSWSSSLAFTQLAASDRTPVRLMRFLEDARSRGVLRTVGLVYQFRHARLQDRLATQEPATGQDSGASRTAGDTAAPAAKQPPTSAR